MFSFTRSHSIRQTMLQKHTDDIKIVQQKEEGFYLFCRRQMDASLWHLFMFLFFPSTSSVYGHKNIRGQKQTDRHTHTYTYTLIHSPTKHHHQTKLSLSNTNFLQRWTGNTKLDAVYKFQIGMMFVCVRVCLFVPEKIVTWLSQMFEIRWSLGIMICYGKFIAGYFE